MELDPKALEAACRAWLAWTGEDRVLPPSACEGPMRDAIRAYLTASRSGETGWRSDDLYDVLKTALEHASFALDGVVALDDEDEGKDGGSKTCQHAKRTVDRALKKLTSAREMSQ